MNSNLLKEAIADAKAVRATALANAKAALEEAFNNRFSAVFADKLREDSAIEQTPQPTDVVPVAEGSDKDKVGATKPSKNDGTVSLSKDNGDPAAKPKSKNITPNTIPAAKDGGDGTKSLSSDNKGNAMDGTPKGIKETTEEVATTEESVEEIPTNEDLNEIIRELEAEANDIPDAPPTPGADAGAEPPPSPDAGAETPEEQDQEIKSGDTVVISKVETPPTDNVPPAPPVGEPTAEEPPAPPVEEEEIDINELIKSLNEETEEEEEEESTKKDGCVGEGCNKEEEEESVVKENSSLKEQLAEAISQRDEAYNTVQYLKTQICEVNLLNAKLLYTNKLFKEFAMNHDQKTKVVEAFDLTKNVREVKLTYANWCESLNIGGNLKRKPVMESKGQITTVTDGSASKPVASTKPEIINENVNEQARRFQVLAGIGVKKQSRAKN